MLIVEFIAPAILLREAIRAELDMSENLGSAEAAKIPKITITIINSMREKPD